METSTYIAIIIVVVLLLITVYFGLHAKYNTPSVAVVTTTTPSGIASQLVQNPQPVAASVTPVAEPPSTLSNIANAITSVFTPTSVPTPVSTPAPVPETSVPISTVPVSTVPVSTPISSYVPPPDTSTQTLIPVQMPAPVSISTPSPDPIPIVLPPTIIIVPEAPKFVGCYKDTATRALPQFSGYKTISECNALAKKANAPYFGMQYAQGSNVKDGAQCFYGGTNYAKYGVANNCSNKDSTGRILGAYWNNAVYKTV